eukprot:TRINITY_DN1_c0_g1_i1.p1 TRINITY_DN1_c0_g1~~TRINITY_DN1_c0_g1_i1.p1  ORF type:complete len:364 (-),score=48.98 TRINITY_DN1_c0_g1_i1:89-1180(-)
MKALLLVSILLVLKLSQAETPKLTNSFLMADNERTWRKGFNVFDDKSNLVMSLKTYCPNWKNAGPVGRNEVTGDRFLETSWDSASSTWTVTYGDSEIRIQAPTLLTVDAPKLNYHADYILYDRNGQVLGYVPWSRATRFFTLIGTNERVIANATREPARAEWKIELVSEYSGVAAIDVALLVHIYEYTIMKNGVSLSDPHDTCTPFLLYTLPFVALLPFIIFGIAVAWWYKSRNRVVFVPILDEEEDSSLASEYTPLVPLAAPEISSFYGSNVSNGNNIPSYDNRFADSLYKDDLYGEDNLAGNTSYGGNTYGNTYGGNTSYEGNTSYGGNTSYARNPFGDNTSYGGSSYNTPYGNSNGNPSY